MRHVQVFDEELSRLEHLVCQLATAGVDAVIVQVGAVDLEYAADASLISGFCCAC
jgi:collagenase-like PrtC family protease